MIANGQVISPLFIYFVFIWTTLWKGLALWKAARQNQKNWFITMLVLNLYTLGLLEIIYLVYFSKEKFKLKSLMFWEKK